MIIPSFLFIFFKPDLAECFDLVLQDKSCKNIEVLSPNEEIKTKPGVESLWSCRLDFLAKKAICFYTDAKSKALQEHESFQIKIVGNMNMQLLGSQPGLSFFVNLKDLKFVSTLTDVDTKLNILTDRICVGVATLGSDVQHLIRGLPKNGFN